MENLYLKADQLYFGNKDKLISISITMILLIKSRTKILNIFQKYNSKIKNRQSLKKKSLNSIILFKKKN